MRFWRFNIVGAAGFAIQLAVLAPLLGIGMHYLAATAIAVEAAVLHNFFWHERWTWRDRPVDTGTRLGRLWRFHVLNGVVSLAGNLLIMRLLVGAWGVAPLPANLVAVVACAAINFVGADRLVFSQFRLKAEVTAREVPPEGGSYGLERSAWFARVKGPRR